MPSRNFPDPREETRQITPEELPGDGEEPSDLLKSLPVKPQKRYQFLRSIGFGGMKGVLLVYDRDTGREVAMAIMPDFRERPQRDLERFVREARITARLEHPNIVPVHDIGIDKSGSPYYTMKYLRGCSLAVILKRLRSGEPETLRKYDMERLLQIFIRICNAVAFAHNQGYCHLDLKPGNVNVGDFGEVVVLDWGLAAQADGTGFVPGPLNGTPGYIAPELIRSQGKLFPGPAADVYALGGVLYSMLTLGTPFCGHSQEEMLQLAAEGLLPPPSQAAPAGREIPEGLEAICMKAMSVDPAKRYRQADDLRRDILAYRSGYAPKAEGSSWFLQMRHFLRRNRYHVVIVLLLLLSAAALMLALYYRRQWLN